MRFLSKPIRVTILVIIFALISFFIIKKIEVREIVCQSQFGPCSDLILEEIERARGKNLVDSYSVLSKTLTLSSSIEDYRVEIGLPFKLKVNVIERKPRHAIRKVSEEHVYLIDSGGYVVSIRKDVFTPALEVEGDLPDVGDRLSAELVFALSIVEDVASVFEVKGSNFSSGKLEVVLSDGKRIIFPSRGDNKVLVGALVAIIQRLNSNTQETRIGNEEGVMEIDLRFKNPIIR